VTGPRVEGLSVEGLSVEGLSVEGLRVTFGETVALDDLTLEIAPGEIVAVVGPSGCGKSTLLRVIAGLEVPDRGTVAWGGTDITRAAPHERGFGLMFQDHALFPHRSVRDNVAFGLRMQRLPARAQHTRTAMLLRLVGLEGFEHRSVDTLSGGEAQRVALARALAPAPRLLMLDEPLGSLDRALRDRLAVDVREVLREIGQAAIHVTHDQEEAYAVADRLVVMRAGRVERDGPTVEVWRDPGSEFVARFLAHENVLDAETAAALGVGDGDHPVVVREAAIAVGPEGLYEAKVADVRFRGATSRVLLHIERPGAPPVALVWHTPQPPAVGRRLRVGLDRAQVAELRA
jgi:thiamine transport system ATP-binding protein